MPVMDVRAENRGRPHQEVRFPAAPVVGRNFFDSWASGRKGQECPQKIRTKKFMFMLLCLPCSVGILQKKRRTTSKKRARSAVCRGRSGRDTGTAFLAFRSRVKTRTAIYRSLQALRARNSQKVSKKSPRPSRPGVFQKVSKRVEKSQKSIQKRLFRDFFETFDSFRDFLDTPGRRVGETFLRLFGDFGPGGPGDSCKWPFRS